MSRRTGIFLPREVLDEQRRYSVLDEKGQPTFFSLLYSGSEYSLLSPVDVGEYSVQYYVPFEYIADVSLGQAVVVFGGSGQGAQLYTGIVSQKKMSADAVEAVRISIVSSNTVSPSVVFIEDSFAGFTQPYSDWVSLLDGAFVAGAIQAMQVQGAVGDDASVNAGLSQ